jgi:hypothetical protein
MESASRTVRFKGEELKLIEEFLESNPFFDFSTLTRTSIIHFIRNPELIVKPVGVANPKSKFSERKQNGKN